MSGVNWRKGVRKVRPKKAAHTDLFVTLYNFITMSGHFMLQTPIQELHLSESFKEMAQRHGFKSIEEMLNWPADVLLMHDGFTYHHYQELRNFLKTIDSNHLIKTSNSKLVEDIDPPE